MTSFVAYINCSVLYDGRATSVLDNGNYLVSYKEDGSLLIHGSKLCTPKNYMGPGTSHSRDENAWTFRRKNEAIVININSILWEHELSDWSDNKIKMSKTENDLRQKLIKNICHYIGFTPISIYEEFNTDLGPVDLLVVDQDGVRHVIELKRGKASINACVQLQKYLSVLDGAIGYVASPAISPKALKKLNESDCKYIAIDFD